MASSETGDCLASTYFCQFEADRWGKSFLFTADFSIIIVSPWFDEPSLFSSWNPVLFSNSNYTHNLPIRSVYRPSPFGEFPFHWVESGVGDEYVVFLHGIMAHSMAFRCVLESSARRFRVIVPDLPGHGRDRTFESDVISPSLDGLLRWLEGFLDTIGDDAPIHLVGHSLGATLGYLAALNPERYPSVSSLTLVSPGLEIRVPPWTGSLVGKLPARLARLGITRAGVRLYEPLQWRRARMTDREISDYLHPIRQLHRIRYILGIGSDLVDQTGSIDEASNIDLRSLIIWGDSDHLLPLPTAHRLHEAIPDARLEIFENCGHCPMEDCPTDFHDVLSQFLINH